MRRPRRRAEGARPLRSSRPRPPSGWGAWSRRRSAASAWSSAASGWPCAGSRRARPTSARATGGWRLGPRGAETAELLISANPGEDLRPLAKVVSGGELSRTMLAVKTILAAADQVPTLVFDEVDAGIGGRVADVVGQKLRRPRRAAKCCA